MAAKKRVFVREGPVRERALGSQVIKGGEPSRSRPTASVTMTVLVVEGDLSDETAAAVGNLIGSLIRR
jgi:hypothetical protein